MRPGRNLPANPTTSKSVVTFTPASSARPRSHTDPAATGQDRNTTRHQREPLVPLERAAPASRSAHPSFPQNDIEQCGQRCGHLEPHRGNDMPRQPTALTSNRLVPAERQPADPFVQARRVRAVFGSPHPGLSTLGGPTNEPTSQPAHATSAGSPVTQKRSPHFVPP